MHQCLCADVESCLLSDRPDAAATVAEWYFAEWGQKIPGLSRERLTAKVQASLNRDRLPLIVLAIEDGEVVGATELKYREMDIYPEMEHWLGGVFVTPRCRGRGVASFLASSVVDIAWRLGVQVLHLQTEHETGGLYARLGWKPMERVRYKGTSVLVMARAIGA